MFTEKRYIVTQYFAILIFHFISSSNWVQTERHLKHETFEQRGQHSCTTKNTGVKAVNFPELPQTDFVDPGVSIG